jgi:site-specific recombinase XerD
MLRVAECDDGTGWSVVNDAGNPVAIVEGYLRRLLAQGFSPHTVRAYAYDLLSFWRWLAQEELDVWSVGTSDLLVYIRWEKERANPQRPGDNVYRIEDGRATGMSALTINRRLAAIHGLYEHLMLEEPDRLARNPVPRGQVGRGWRLPARPRGLLGHLAQRRAPGPLRLRVPHRLPRGLAPVEVERLVGSFRTYRDKAIALLMLYGGLRSCEVLRLKLGDVDLAAKTVRVFGKGASERVVPVDEDALRMVHRYVLYERPDSREPKIFLVGKGPRRGRPLTAEGLRRLFRYHRVRADVPAGNPHRLRHTYATNLAEAGVDAHVLRDLMGHAHLDSSLAYVHLTAAHLRDAYDRAVAQVKARESDESR